MKYIEPPSKKRLKVGPIYPKKSRTNGIIRAILIIGTMIVICILSQYL